MTPAMYRALDNLVRGKDIAHGLSGRSEHGGFFKTRQALRRRNWITPKDEITDEGCAAYRAAKEAAKRSGCMIYKFSRDPFEPQSSNPDIERNVTEHVAMTAPHTVDPYRTTIDAAPKEIVRSLESMIDAHSSADGRVAAYSALTLVRVIESGRASDPKHVA